MTARAITNWCPYCEGDLITLSFGAGIEPFYCNVCEHDTLDFACGCEGCRKRRLTETNVIADAANRQDR